MALPVVIGMSATTAAILGAATATTVAVGAYLSSGQSQEAEERRAREAAEMSRNTELLAKDAEHLREIVALQQRAAEVERALTQRVEQLSGALAQISQSRSQVEGTLRERNQDLIATQRNRVQIQEQLQAALREGEQRNEAYNRAQEENGALRRSLAAAAQGSDVTQQELGALRVENGRLETELAANRAACHDLTNALERADVAVRDLEGQLGQLRGMSEGYDREIARLGERLEDLGRRRTAAHAAGDALPAAGPDAYPDFRRMIDDAGDDLDLFKTKMDDTDFDFQKTLQLSLQDPDEDELALAIAASRRLQEEEAANEEAIALALSESGLV